MTITATPSRKDRRKTFVRNLGDGVKLKAEVSPCVFMYPPYPLQVQVTLHRRPGEQLGSAYAVDRTKTAETYTDADVRRLLAGVGTTPCPRCSTPAFNPATIKTNRGGLCEGCFVHDVDAEFAAAMEAEERQITARDRRMKRKGMLIRVSAWVHSEQCGDDYQVDWYLNHQPTPEEVGAVLRKEGSCRVDDYQIVIL